MEDYVLEFVDPRKTAIIKNAEELSKCFKLFFAFEVVSLVQGIIHPLFGSIAFLDELINLVLNIGMIYVLYKLSHIYNGYEIVYKIQLIVFILNQVFGLLPINVVDSLLVIISLISLIGSLAEIYASFKIYSVHADLIEVIDEELAKKWIKTRNLIIVGLCLVAVGTFIFAVNANNVFISNSVVVIISLLMFIGSIIALVQMVKIMILYKQSSELFLTFVNGQETEEVNEEE